jgi:hypothetical protein
MGFGSLKDGPRCVEAKRKTSFTPKEMTVKRQEGRAKNVKSPPTRAIIGRRCAIKRGPTARLLSFYRGDI